MADKFVMLVEGPDDYHVLQHLLTTHGVNKQIPYRLEGYRAAPKLFAGNEIVFRVLEGVENVRKEVVDYLSQQLKISGNLKCLGVVVDADGDFAARWQSLRDVLIKSGYTNVPKQADPLGLIVEHSLEPDERPRVGVWIMPNNKDTGSMEHFFALLLPSDNTLWSKRGFVWSKFPRKSGSSKTLLSKPMCIPGWLGKQGRDCQWDKPSPTPRSP